MGVAITSLLAYSRIEESLGNRQQEVLRCIREHGPITNIEIAEILKKAINKITGRTTELHKKGLIRQCGTKRIEGFLSSTWEAVYLSALF